MPTIVTELQHIQITRRINSELCLGLLCALGQEGDVQARASVAAWMQTILEIVQGNRRVDVQSCVIKQLGCEPGSSDRLIDFSHVLVRCRLLWRPNPDYDWLSDNRTGGDGSLVFSMGSDADAVQEAIPVIAANIRRFLDAASMPAAPDFSLPHQLLT
jgi:hypothetical protein